MSDSKNQEEIKEPTLEQRIENLEQAMARSQTVIKGVADAHNNFVKMVARDMNGLQGNMEILRSQLLIRK